MIHDLVLEGDLETMTPAKVEREKEKKRRSERNEALGLSWLHHSVITPSGAFLRSRTSLQ